MSTEASDPSEFGTGDFASYAKERMTGADGNMSLPGFSDVPVDKVPTDLLKRAVKSRGDGVTVEDVTDEYGVSDGPAFVVRGVTRMAGINDVPPVADIAVGLFKIVRGE